MGRALYYIVWRWQRPFAASAGRQARIPVVIGWPVSICTQIGAGAEGLSRPKAATKLVLKGPNILAQDVSPG